MDGGCIPVKLKYQYFCTLLFNGDRRIFSDIVVAFCSFEICRDAVDKGVIRTGTGVFFDEMDPIAVGCKNICHREFLQEFISLVFVDSQPHESLRRNRNPSTHIFRLDSLMQDSAFL